MPNDGLLDDLYCLIMTDEEGCGCQSDSIEIYAEGGCVQLLDTNVQSYRFVHVSALSSAERGHSIRPQVLYSLTGL